METIEEQSRGRNRFDRLTVDRRAVFIRADSEGADAPQESQHSAEESERERHSLAAESLARFRSVSACEEAECSDLEWPPGGEQERALSGASVPELLSLQLKDERGSLFDN